MQAASWPLRRSRIVDVLCGCAAALLLVVGATSAAEPADGAPPASTARLRVLTYNIHHGEGVDGKLDLPRIAGVIRAAEADVVALQEVDQRTMRTGQVNQAETLAELTGMHVVFGGNIRFQGGDYGNAVLSRYPVLGSKNQLLPLIGGGEQRGVLAVEIQWPGKAAATRLLATHLAAKRDDVERVASAQAINALIDAAPPLPSILAGDLNDTSNSRTLQTLATHWASANDAPLPTIPVGKPLRQIDFVLLRPAERWRVVEVRVLEEAVASDHRALLAVIELLPADTK